MASFSQILIVSSSVIIPAFNLVLYKSSLETPYLGHYELMRTLSVIISLTCIRTLNFPSVNRDISELGFHVSIETYNSGMKILSLYVRSRICVTYETVCTGTDFLGELFHFCRILRLVSQNRAHILITVTEKQDRAVKGQTFAFQNINNIYMSLTTHSRIMICLHEILTT
jgi:hypothetical protein